LHAALPLWGDGPERGSARCRKMMAFTPQQRLLRCTSFALACLLATAGSYPSLKLEAKAKDVGLSAERLERVSDFFEEQVDIGPLPFARAVIVKNGKLVYDYTAERNGNASLGVLESPEAEFRWYSMSKVLTSVGILVLMEQGKLHLRDKVSDYLPEFKDMKVVVGNYEPNATLDSTSIEDAKKPILIVDLLRHTSGISYGGLFQEYGLNTPGDQIAQSKGYNVFTLKPEDVEDSENPGSEQKYSKLLASLPLNFEPGTRYEYSPGHAVCGAIIQAITGQSSEKWMFENVFKPIGATGFRATPTDKTVPVYVAAAKDIPSTIAHSRRHMQTSADFKKENIILNPTHPKWPFDAITANKHGRLMGDAGWVGRMIDMVLFARTIGNKGLAPNGFQLLSPTTVSLMLSNNLPNNALLNTGHGLIAGSKLLKNGGVMGFGLGGAVHTEAFGAYIGSIGSSPGMYEWCGIASTGLIIDPKNDMQIVFASQVWEAGFHPKSFGGCGMVGLGRRLIHASIVEDSTSNTCKL